MRTNQDIRAAARRIRQDVVRMQQRGPGVGSALSCADVLAVLYLDVLKLEPVREVDRDVFILSKGHAASAYYATLAECGRLDRSCLEGFLTDGSALSGHPSRELLAAVDVSTGSLGHGVAVGAGMAWGARHDGKSSRVYVLCGDGELQEGSVWESAMLAAALELENLVVIVDANGLQGYGRVDDLMPIRSITAKWESFGWCATDVDGHDVGALRSSLAKTPLEQGKPTVVVARTVKGKGIADMEGQFGWHYFSVPRDAVDRYIAELEANDA